MKTLRRASYGVLEKVGIININSDINKKNSRGATGTSQDELLSRITILENENSNLQRKLVDKDRHVGMELNH